MSCFIAIIAIVSCLSCNSDKSDEKTGDALPPYNLLSIHCPPDVLNAYLHTQVFADSLLYGVDPALPFEIAVFDLKKKAFSHKIHLDPHFFKEKIGSFYVHCPDSIFVTGMNYPFVYIISSGGQIIQKFDLTEMNTYADYIIPSLFPYTSPYYDSKKKYLYVTTLPYDWDVLVAKTQFAERVFDLGAERMVAEYASLSTDQAGVLPYDLNTPYRLVTDSTIIISYPARHEIEIYDKEKHELISKKMAGNEQVKLSEPLSLKNNLDEQAFWNYRVTVPFYEPIFYHPKAKCFTRILHHAQELKPDGVTLNNGEERKATLLIFDKEFLLLQAFHFTNGSLGVRKSISLPDGLLIAPHEAYWENDNELAFQYYFKLLNLNAL